MWETVMETNLRLFCGVWQPRNVVGKETFVEHRRKEQMTIHQNAPYKHKECGCKTPLKSQRRVRTSVSGRQLLSFSFFTLNRKKNNHQIKKCE